MKVYKVIEGRMHSQVIESRDWLLWARFGWAGCRKFARSVEQERVSGLGISISTSHLAASASRDRGRVACRCGG